MATPVSIRQITPDDLDIVRELAMEIWPKCYRNIIPPDHIDAMLASLYSLEALELEMSEDKQVFWLASIRNQNVGYASAKQTGDDLWIKKLYVMDDYRGQNIGNMFIDAALALFAKSKRLKLNVNHDNAPAIAYYLKNNFVVEQEVKVVMGPYAFTDLLMSKAI